MYSLRTPSKSITLEEGSTVLGRHNLGIKDNKVSSRCIGVSVRGGQVFVIRLCKNPILLQSVRYGDRGYYVLKCNVEHLFLPDDVLFMLVCKYPVILKRDESIRVNESVVKRPISVLDMSDSDTEEMMVDKVDVKSTLKHSSPFWSNHSTIHIYNPIKTHQSSSIASFDMDSTLIETKSGRLFATDPSDWEFFCDNVVPRLTSLHENGYDLVIFTNQNGIGTGKQDLGEFKTKVEDIIHQLGVPVLLIATTKKDHFRKPGTGMWEYYKNELHMGTIDLSSSIYVGDAAGRPKTYKRIKGKPRRDFSCSDRKFAHNIKVNFATPEEFFLDEKPADFEWGSIDPQEILDIHQNLDLINGDITKPHQEAIIMVGFPGSGKSSFTKKHLVTKNYVRVNQDELKTASKCKKFAQEALSQGKSVVIDNTNSSVKKRGEYICLFEKYNVPYRCFKMNTGYDVAKHMNHYRVKITQGETKLIPDIAYNVFKKHFVEPTYDEGFSEILSVNLIPSFSTKKELEIFLQKN